MAGQGLSLQHERDKGQQSTLLWRTVLAWNKRPNQVWNFVWCLVFLCRNKTHLNINATSSPKVHFVAWETAWLVKCLAEQLEKLGSVPGTYIQRPGVVMLPPDTCTGELEAGEFPGLHNQPA